MYHKTCRVRYISKGAKVQGKEDSLSSTVKRESAFSQLLSHIDSEIFLKNKSEKLVDVNQVYIEFLIKEGIEEPTPDSYHLLSKLKEHYGNKLQVNQESKKQGIYLSLEQNAIKNNIKNVALFLRRKIWKLRESKLQNPISVEAIRDGQCSSIPAELSEFYRILYTGSKDEGNQRVE